MPVAIALKLGTVTDDAGNPLQSLARFAQEWSGSVKYKFVSESDLSRNESAIFRRWREIADLAGRLPREVKEVKVSETMRPSVTEGMNPAGLWEPANGWVIVHREQLRSLGAFAGTLLHEFTHASTGYADVSRDFECALTDLIGKLAARALPPAMVRRRTPRRRPQRRRPSSRRH